MKEAGKERFEMYRTMKYAYDGEEICLLSNCCVNRNRAISILAHPLFDRSQNYRPIVLLSPTVTMGSASPPCQGPQMDEASNLLVRIPSMGPGQGYAGGVLWRGSLSLQLQYYLIIWMHV